MFILEGSLYREFIGKVYFPQKISVVVSLERNFEFSGQYYILFVEGRDVGQLF